MIYLQTEYFKLDLSGYNVKFSEENTFYQKGVLKQYTFPFDVSKNFNSIEFFNFIDSHNSTIPNDGFKATLFRNDKFYEAEFFILSVGSKVKMNIYYSFDQLSIFEQKLNTLPWPKITVGSDMFSFAKTTISQDYPTTKINFPRVYVGDLYEGYDYGYKATGYINLTDDGEFSDNFRIGFDAVRRNYMNELRPFIYTQEVIKFIFEQIGYTVQGDLFTHPLIEKALLYHQNNIYYKNEDNPVFDVTYQLLSSGSGNYATYNQIFNHAVRGRFTLKFEFEHEIQSGDTSKDLRVFIYVGGSLLVYKRRFYNGDGTYSSIIEHDFHNVNKGDTTDIEIQIGLDANAIDRFTSTLEIIPSKQPLYEEEINMADLLPDKTVGQFIDDVKETFITDSIFNLVTKTVTFDFYDTFKAVKQAVDLSEFEILDVSRTPSKVPGYKFEFGDGETLFLDKLCEVQSEDNGFKSKSIGIEPLKLEYKYWTNVGFTPNVSDQSGLSMLFYESNVDANPMSEYDGVELSRIGFITLFMRTWFFQELNAVQYKQRIIVPSHIGLKIDSEAKLWMYNNYFLIRKLSRKNLHSLFEEFDLTFEKLALTPVFTNDNTVFSPQNPSLWTTVDSDPDQAGTNTSAFTGIQKQGIVGFEVEIYADGSTDPENLELFYKWEIVSYPGQGDFGDVYVDTFYPLIDDYSAVKIRVERNSNPAGTYVFRITAENYKGGTASKDLTITVV